MLAVAAIHVQAAITTDAIYADHMVLQHGQAVSISGTCTENSPITVSFAGQTVTATIKNNKWTAELSPMSVCNEGRSITISQGDDTLNINDVLVGEVWIASGQSNMLWRLNQTGDRNSLNEAVSPHFRFYHSEPQVHTSPPAYNDREKKLLLNGEMYQGSWRENTPQNRARMSAVGYYFGRELQQELGIPVGVIHVALGGSEMMAWMPPDVLKQKYRECTTARWLESKYMSDWVRGRARQNIGKDLNAPHPYKPGYLFRTGISPWKSFPVAGVIWYQGESDAEIQDMKQNYTLLRDLITGWRKELDNPELPFLMVELPRINDKSKLRAYWPEFRSVQQKAASDMKKVYTLTTIDLGSRNSDVHPPRKLEVGTRLAHLAAAKVYNKNIPSSGPVVSKVEPKENAILLHYTFADGLKTIDGTSPKGFEVSSDGRKFLPAQAEIQGEKVILTSPDVKSPRYARYAWATYLEPNLVNQHGLPAVPYAPTAW